MDFTNPSHRLGFALAIVIVIAVAGGIYYTRGEETKSAADAYGTEGTSAQATLQPAPATQTQTNVKSATNVILKTSHGEIELALFPDKAPTTVANFIELSKKGFYSGTKFHRVIKGFMIQGGDPLTKDDSRMGEWGSGGPGYQFEDEINDQKIVRGILAMANAGPGTNGSQFFIVTAGATPWLDGKHTAFGKVIRGMDVVDKIESVPVTDTQRHIPKTPVVIQEVIIR